MWLATRYGFFSVVRAHGPGGPTDPHPTKMMIRARKHSHLAKLKRAFPGLGPIVRNTGTDYPYRIFAGQDIVVKLMEGLATEINYTNFKSEVHGVLHKDTAYHRFLMSVWGLGLRLTPSKARRRVEGFFGRRGYAAPPPADGLLV